MATHANTVFGRADQLAGLVGQPPIERPQQITRRAAPMTRFWPDCAICKCTLQQCECDPDDYSAALLKMWGVS